MIDECKYYKNIITIVQSSVNYYYYNRLGLYNILTPLQNHYNCVFVKRSVSLPGPEGISRAPVTSKRQYKKNNDLFLAQSMSRAH